MSADKILQIVAGMNVLLAVYYLIMSLLYLYTKQYGKAVYWFGAILLTLGVFLQK